MSGNSHFWLSHIHDVLLLFSGNADFTRHQRVQKYVPQVLIKYGHGDVTTPSHFIAINLNRHIQVIELPGGDASKAKIYTGPILMPGQELTPVTLSFRDVNGDGKPDLLGLVGSGQFVFINDTINHVAQFRPIKPEEQITL